MSIAIFEEKLTGIRKVTAKINSMKFGDVIGMNSVVQILESVSTYSAKNFYEKIRNDLNNKTKRFVVTANPEIIMNGRKNERMFEILTKEAIVIPDGIGVSKAVQFLKKNIVERNTGVDFAEFLLKLANDKGYRVFIYGAKQEILDALTERCKKEWPRIIFTGVYNGYENSEEYILKKLRARRAEIYLIALGTPRQELFINKFFGEINSGICVGVGGSLDVLSGQIRRAPKFFLRHNLEWLYRISTQPNRLKRFLQGNVLFVFVFLLDYMKGAVKRKLAR